MEIVSLRNVYNKQLLNRFYNELLVPNFGKFPDELQELVVFERGIQERNYPYLLNIILVMKDDDLLGGCSYDFYRKSNCGLLAYIVVKPQYRNLGISKILIERTLQDLNLISSGTLKGLFLETHSDNIVNDVLEPKLRVQILKKLGFTLLNFNYIQPALSHNGGKSYDLMLAVHKNYSNSKIGSVCSKIILDWLFEVYSITTGRDPLLDDDFKSMAIILKSTNRIKYTK